MWKIRPPRGCEREDLAQEARIGLIAAIRAWRPERGPFPAFADRCVTNQALLAVELCARNKHQLLSQAISLEGVHAPRVKSGGDGLALRLLDALAATGGGWDPESHFLVREQLDGVLRALPTLTPKERHSLVGILSGESYEALGRAVAAPQGGIASGGSRAPQARSGPRARRVTARASDRPPRGQAAPRCDPRPVDQATPTAGSS